MASPRGSHQRGIDGGDGGGGSRRECDGSDKIIAMIDVMQGYDEHGIIGFGIIISMIINSINVVFWEGHIFQKIGDYMESQYPTLWKPIGGCIICQTPWWGVLICLLLGWPYLSIIVAMGINVLIVRWEPKD